MKIYALVDCDSFFASCEKVFRPDWAEKPIVVLSNNDGCVIARSVEAKPLVAMGTPWFRIKSLAKQLGLVVCSSNHVLYGDMSRRVMETLGQWSYDVEVYSIDEAFLDLTRRYQRDLEEGKPIGRSLATLGREITETVPRLTGIPVSVGIGPNKTLAKLANRIAKDLPGRLFGVMNRAKREKVLKAFPIADLWGVGRKLLPRLERFGLKTAWDLSQLDPLVVRREFSVAQERLVRELNGEVCYGEEPPEHKNIQITRSFGKTITEAAELEKAFASFAVRGARRLRHLGLKASAVSVSIATNLFRPELPQHSPVSVVGFYRPTDDTVEILKGILPVLRTIYKAGYAYKRGGITLMDLVPADVALSQESLFGETPDFESPLGTDQSSRQKRAELYRAVDRVNEIGGRTKIFFAPKEPTESGSPLPSLSPHAGRPIWIDFRL